MRSRDYLTGNGKSMRKGRGNKTLTDDTYTAVAPLVSLFSLFSSYPSLSCYTVPSPLKVYLFIYFLFSFLFFLADY